MNENMNLNDLMGGKQRHGSTTVDLTSGQAVVKRQENEESIVVEPTPMKPVQTGPVDVNNLRSVDINSILPKRKQEADPVSAQIMNDLDMAIDRECEKITEFHKELAAKQDEEMAAAEEAEMDSEFTEVDKESTTSSNPCTAEEDENYGLYETDGDDDEFFMQNNNDNLKKPIINPEKLTQPSAVEPAAQIENIPVVDGSIADEEVKEEKKPVVNILDNISDEELYEDDDEEDTNAANPDAPSTEEIINDLKVQIRSRISDNKKIDLSKFTIAKKAISAQKVMKLAVEKHMNTADWVLPGAGRSISMTGLSGPEILKLNPDNSTRNRQNTFRDMYRIMYDHLVDANKPDFETWLKQTRFVDLQHIYFTLYMATFGGSNFINYTCPKCQKVFIKDVSFEDMVNYADEETKKKIAAMLKQDTTSKNNDSYDVDLVQVSANYVFGIRTPSIWNVIMETSSLSEQFLEKHADLIDMVAYIDSAYVIDMNTNELILVDTKPVPNDMTKTAGRKIKAMYDIISTLDSDEFYALRSKINEYDEFANTKISYKIPGTVCPHCTTEIPENTDITPDTMLFTRHQLAAIANM